MNIKTKILTGIFLSSVVSASASDVVAIPGVKSPVVVVDLMRMGSEAKEFNKKQESLKADIDAKVKDIETLQAKFQKTFQELQVKAKDMTQAALEKAQEELGKMQGEIEIKKRNLEAYIQKVVADAEKSLVDQVKKICKELGFGIVLPGALHFAPEYDKTDVVIKELNKNVKVDAKPATKAPAKK